MKKVRKEGREREGIPAKPHFHPQEDPSPPKSSLAPQEAPVTLPEKSSAPAQEGCSVLSLTFDGISLYVNHFPHVLSSAGQGDLFLARPVSDDLRGVVVETKDLQRILVPWQRVKHAVLR